MKDSSDIRKFNMLKIKKILRQGGEYTKQQIANITGLSVATCNTLLNEMQGCGEVLGEKKRFHEVGRESVCYRINEDFETFLCLFLELHGEKRRLFACHLSVTGRVMEQKEEWYTFLDAAAIADAVAKMCGGKAAITQIVVGIPGIAEGGVVRHCDIPELEDAALKESLENRFHISVHLENDMHLKAYGYYRRCGSPDEIVTLAYFPEHILPGTASVHKGMVLQGKNQFAGMVGFLPYDVDREEELSLLKKDTCRPFISKAVTAIIAIVNPGIIVLTGELLDEDSMKWIRSDCLRHIPEEYMPVFCYEESLDSLYVEGMYQRALDCRDKM